MPKTVQSFAMTDEMRDRAQEILDDNPGMDTADLKALLTAGRYDDDGEWHEGAGLPDQLAHVVMYVKFFPYEGEEDVERKMSLYRALCEEFSVQDIMFVNFIAIELADFIKELAEAYNDGNQKH